MELTPRQSLENLANWLQQHKTLAKSKGAEIDLVVMPQDAEAAMVAALMSENIRADMCHMVEKKDNTVRIYLMGIPIKFTTRLPGNIAWFRYKGEKR